jgi:hypothetical protein
VNDFYLVRARSKTGGKVVFVASGADPVHSVTLYREQAKHFTRAEAHEARDTVQEAHRARDWKVVHVTVVEKVR